LHGRIERGRAFLAGRAPRIAVYFFQAQDAPAHLTERARPGALLLANEPAAPGAEVEVFFVERERPHADGAGLDFALPRFFLYFSKAPFSFSVNYLWAF